MRIIILVFTCLLPISFSFTQTKTETDIDSAYQNAKKGVRWALSNIPGKKSKLDNDLIVNDKLCASVKLDKEINGIRIISVGHNSSNEVTIKIFKSFDNLAREGYLKGYEMEEFDLLKKK